MSPSPESDWITKTLSLLDSVSGWTFGALAIGSACILYYPYSVGIDLTAFRKENGGLLFTIMVISASLTLAKLLKTGYSSLLNQRNHRTFHFTPLSMRCWWAATKQKDGRFSTQIVADCDALNLTDKGMQFYSVRLVRPKVSDERLIQSHISVFRANSSEIDYIPAHRTGVVRISFLIWGTIVKTGHSLKATMAVTDRFGNKQRIKLVFRDMNVKP